jgi:regulator of protease activity HflC (stomatin/prohibitin superfamily)
VNVVERDLKLGSGWVGLVGVAAGVGLAGYLAYTAAGTRGGVYGWAATGVGLLIFVGLFGFVVNGPNTARVVQLFGTYVGTLKDTGFFWANPFYVTTKVSLRVRSFETGVNKTDEVKDAAGKVTHAATSTRKPLKVNDKDGTPIEVAAVVVWKVIDATTAVFQVDDYEEYVTLQADAALRGLASRYSYDAPETDRHSLRGHIDEVAAELRNELHARMSTAGVDVIESRISYLAYAPEIAAAMLQRQQAGAVVAARQQIVDAAVGMVQHALDELTKRNVVELDPERKAAMVSNLLVVLCSHHAAAPVVNAGTLY